MLTPLTPRETEVLALAATGATNAEMAEHLAITVGTVKRHLETIYSKLGARDRTQAVVIAIESGMLLLPKLKAL